MSRVLASSTDLEHFVNIQLPAGAWLSLPASSNAQVTEHASSRSGGSVSLESTLSVSGASNDDSGFSRLEASHLLIVRAPGPGPFTIDLSFGNVYVRAEGKTRDEFGFSSHMIW